MQPKCNKKFDLTTVYPCIISMLLEPLIALSLNYNNYKNVHMNCLYKILYHNLEKSCKYLQFSLLKVSPANDALQMKIM
jgi:hypothetical protein